MRASRWSLVPLLMAVVGAGCATSQQVGTPHYALSVPDFWQVTQVAASDGQATRILAVQFGDAIIDDGPAAMAQSGSNYDSLTGEVELRIYSWSDPVAGAEPDLSPANAVEQRLGDDADLQLYEHLRVAERPNECNRFARRYQLAGQTLTPIELVKRPGWRTIVLGTRQGDVLLGVVARVEFQQDHARYCHNLRNLQVQLQTMLDGLRLGGAGKPAGAEAPARVPAAGDSS